MTVAPPRSALTQLAWLLAAVHNHLRAARTAGSAVIVYSSDLDEVLALADRMIVVHAGRVRAVERSRDAIGRAMLGAV